VLPRTRAPVAVREDVAMHKVNLLNEGANVTELWGRVTPLRFNDYDVHVNRIHGEYVWHSHADTDDVFMVLSGRMTVQLRTGDVELGPGDMFVVPAGVEHCPKADVETVIMCIEPRGTAPSGD
jgi:mannose-6-phosphate isomerase-like protein (cupin superfamily)